MKTHYVRQIRMVAGLIILAQAGLAVNQSGSISISPSSPTGRWETNPKLKLYESASLTINVAQGGWVGGVQYVLKSANYPNLPPTDEFLWYGSGGSYTISNMRNESAHASVTVTCLWMPKPTEGGGPGSGAGPRDIKGEAVGLAKARDGDYWNEAQDFIKAVGTDITVLAKRENDPNLVPSTWNITGGQADVEVFGTGGAADIKGTKPSPSMGGTVVKSTCIECGKSDTEALTFVGVEFEPGAVSVCKGGTASLTAIVQPQQASDSVDFDTEHVGIATVSGSAPDLTLSGVDAGTTTVRGKVAGDICGQTGIEVVGRVSGYVHAIWLWPEDGEIVHSGPGIPVRHGGWITIYVRLCDGAPTTDLDIKHELFGPAPFDQPYIEEYGETLTASAPVFSIANGLYFSDLPYNEMQAGEQTGTIRITVQARYPATETLSHSDTCTFTVEVP